MPTHADLLRAMAQRRVTDMFAPEIAACEAGAAALAIVQRLAAVKPCVSVFGARGAVIVNGRSYYCIFCGHDADERQGDQHKPNCLYDDARSLCPPETPR